MPKKNPLNVTLKKKKFVFIFKFEGKKKVGEFFLK